MGHTTAAGPVASAATGIILYYIILYCGPRVLCRCGAALDCLAIRAQRTGKESISALVSQSYTHTHTH